VPLCDLHRLTQQPKVLSSPPDSGCTRACEPDAPRSVTSDCSRCCGLIVRICFRDAHRMVLSVRRRIHCGMGRFCFAFFARILLIRKDFWDGCRRCVEFLASHGERDGDPKVSASACTKTTTSPPRKGHYSDVQPNVAQRRSPPPPLPAAARTGSKPTGNSLTHTAPPFRASASVVAHTA
jgi:hypothetical protein